MIGSRRHHGFTLTELIITVAIVIILAAIAIPNYRGQVMRSNRSDAMSALLRIAAAQEKFYLQNNTYTDSLGSDGLNVGEKSVNEHYTLNVRDTSLTGFTAEATPSGGQANDKKCAFFSIDEQGTRFARGEDNEETTDLCWR